VHLGGRVLADLLDVARELARDAVVLPTDRLAQGRLRGGLGVGTPSENRRTVNGSRRPLSLVELPTMSLVNMPSTSMPAALACWAKKVEP
jgi:hypothetical protein